jgi:hypothetical protein
MAIKLKPAGKLFIIAAIIAAGIFTVRWYQNRPKEVSQSVDLGKVSLPDAPEASLTSNAVLLSLPSAEKAVNGRHANNLGTYGMEQPILRYVC